MMQADATPAGQDQPPKPKFSERVYHRWSTVLCLFYGLRIAWVSAASVVLGALLFLLAPQAQDLFLEVTGDTVTSVIFWLGFFLAVMTFWGLPVYISSRWILSRFEEGSARTDPNIRLVKPWVRRYLPPMLTVACFGAVLLGQTVQVPIEQGRLVLGTWQRVLFCELDGPQSRRIHAQVMGV